MRSCDTCKFRLGLNDSCMQGHWTPDGRIIKDCHAWQEAVKEKCWWCEDYKWFTDFTAQEVLPRLNRVIGLDKDTPKCPICGRKLGEGK